MDVGLELTSIYYPIICNVKRINNALCVCIDIFEWVGNIIGEDFSYIGHVIMRADLPSHIYLQSKSPSPLRYEGQFCHTLFVNKWRFPK